jgi:hypothetical protein
MTEQGPKRFEDVIKGLPTFKATSRSPQTPTERDDPTVIYNARTLADLAREVLKRASSPPPPKQS